MTDAPPLGTAIDYDTLQAIMRRVADMRGVSRESLDELAGCPKGYAGKVLSEVPIKRLGPLTFGPLLQALGLKLLVVDDPEAMARYTARAEQRDGRQVRVLTSVSIAPKMRFITNRTARKMRRLGVKKLSPARRRMIARHAANTRWKRKKAKKVRRVVLPPCTDIPKAI